MSPNANHIKADPILKLKNPEKRVGGVSANALVMPIVVAVAILHIVIVVVIFMINRTSAELSSTMRNSGIYTQEATSLLAGSSVLSETASNFVLLPTTGAGDVNVGPLYTYAAELAEDRRGDQVLERFKTYEVTQIELDYIESAAQSANAMLVNQLHAIALVRAVHPLPESPQLAAIPEVELTAEELAMPDEQKLGVAQSLVLGSEYAQHKYNVSQSVGACVAMIQEQSGTRSAQVSRRIGQLRTMLWVVTLSIIAMLVFTFSTLYRQILFPLAGFVKLIPQNRTLEEGKGFREVRLVAAAYNDVLKRRDTLDTILRSAAETDALTNLPNRYRFEQFIVEADESDSPVAVLLFDVNYLKKTNDTQGHLAGDALLQKSANCISRCFGENCFRFGGDEFAAIVKDCTPDSIREMVKRFQDMEQEMGVSISMGYAYSTNISRTSFRQLLDEADRNMYVEKQRTHDAR